VSCGSFENPDGVTKAADALKAACLTASPKIVLNFFITPAALTSVIPTSFN
jgi:hypothetical protein